jgi:hypothetical protein
MSRIQLLRGRGRGSRARSSAGRGAVVPVKWRNIGPTNVAGRVAAVAVDRDGRLYRGAAGGGVWRAGTGGTWTPLTDDLGSLSIGAIAISATNPSVLYVGTGEGSIAIDGIDGIGIVRSTDGGVTWIDRSKLRVGIESPDDR